MNDRRRSGVWRMAIRRFTWILGRRLYMRARNDVDNCIATNGERKLQREVLDLLHRRSVDAVVFDVGANVGDWTTSLITQAQAVGSLGNLSVHAFEPFPSTFRAVADRLRDYTASEIVRCCEVALSSEDGEAEMLGEGRLGTSSIHVGIDNRQYDKVHVVRMKADSYCDQNAIQEVHLLKCDTEGHDVEVIKGAHNLLKNGRVWFLQFEYNHRWIYSRHYLKDVFDLSEGIPYELAKVTRDGLELLDAWDPEFERFFEGNYVLIRDDLEHLVTSWRVCRDSHNTFVG